jgi:hypothetical protein
MTKMMFRFLVLAVCSTFSQSVLPEDNNGNSRDVDELLQYLLSSGSPGISDPAARVVENGMSSPDKKLRIVADTAAPAPSKFVRRPPKAVVVRVDA